MLSRIFHDMLARVGDQHCYQRLVTLFCTLINLQTAVATQGNAYLFYQQPYTCPSAAIEMAYRDQVSSFCGTSGQSSSDQGQD